MESNIEQISRLVDQGKLEELEHMSKGIDELILRCSDNIKGIIESGKTPEKILIRNHLQAQHNAILIEAGVRKLKGLDE